MMTPERRAVLAFLGVPVMLAGAAYMALLMLAGAALTPYIVSAFMIVAGGVIIVAADPASYTFREERWSGTMNIKFLNALAVLLLCAGALLAGVIIVSGVLADYPGANTMFAIALLLLFPANIGLMVFLWALGKGVHDA